MLAECSDFFEPPGLNASLASPTSTVENPSLALRAVFPSKSDIAPSTAYPWQKRWAVSMIPLFASQSLDAASSYGLRELNPLLADPDGRFGVRAAAIKFGVIGGMVGVEYLVVKKFPRAAKFFTILNWTMAGATTGLAIRNYRIAGR
jgi:hypothetical protein